MQTNKLLFHILIKTALCNCHWTHYIETEETGTISIKHAESMKLINQF